MSRRVSAIQYAPSATNLPVLQAVLNQCWTNGSRRNLVADYWSSQTPRPAAVMIREAVRRAGLDPNHLSRHHMSLLGALDEFHCLGPQATSELADLAGIEPGCHVLDVGCGIGGPSRRLAVDFGSSVFGIDLTKDYVEAAQELAESMGLSRQISYRHCDAIELPFERRQFNIVWLQVAATNIAERGRLYAEMGRVLKPGGRIAMFDIVAGPGGPVHFPVPWGYDSSTSALLTIAETEATLQTAGFTVTALRDVSDLAAAWFQEQVKLTCRPQGPPPIGFHVLLPEWGLMAYNQLRNICEQRIAFIYLIAE